MNDKKDVLRPTIVMYVFVGLVGMWMGGCQTQEQKVETQEQKIKTQEQKIERLIKQLQDQNEGVRVNAARALGFIGEGAKAAVPTLMPLLKDQDDEGFVRSDAAEALGKIGTPEALKAVKEYQSRQ